MGLNGGLHDDRGESILGAPVSSLARTSQDEELKVLCAAMARRLVKNAPLALQIVIYAMLPGLLLAGVVLSIRWGLPVWGGPLVGIALGIGIMLTTDSLFMRSRPELVTTLLRYGFCPCCAYSLRSCPPGEHGRVRCPECSAEWSAERVLKHTVPPRRAQWDGIRRPPPMLADMQGTIVTLLDLGEVKERARRDERVAAAVARARGWLRSTLVRLGVIGVLGVSTLAACWGLGLVHWSAALVIGAIVAMAVGVLSWTHRGNRILTFNTTRFGRELLRQLVCPGCGEHLERCAKRDDGGATCPGCAAVWRLPRASGSVSGTSR